MRTYYIYLLDHDGHITTRVNVDCAGDAAAVDEAWELMASEGHSSAAIWYLDRQVSVVRAGNSRHAGQIA